MLWNVPFPPATQTRLAVWFSLIVTLSTPSHAQEAADSIKANREAFLKKLQSASAPVTEIYVKALRELEEEAAAVRDYETALAAQRRRASLEIAGGVATGDSDEGSLNLLAANARTTGRISREGGVGVAAEVLIGWKTVGSSATWDVQNITPGIYQVRIQYSCGDPEPYDSDGDRIKESTRFAGGSFYFEEVTNLAGAADNRLSVKVESTGGWKNYTMLNLGEIRIQRTSATFRIVATRVEPLGLMNLRRVYLIPAKDAVPDGAGVVSGSAEPPRLTELRENHAARLATLRSPIAESYIASLRSLADKLPATERESLAALIDAETARAQNIVRSPEFDLGVSPSGDAEPQPPEMESLEGAAWVDDPENRGDVFVVEHQGKKFPVRLYFVSCPDPAGADPKSAHYFGIAEERAAFVGSEAKRFTSRYLADRDLTLFSTGEKDPEGNLLVIVSLRGIGIYERVLVSRGLGMINPGLTASHGNLNASDYVENVLRPTEEKAKFSGRGAWSFSSDRRPHNGEKPSPPRPAPPGSPNIRPGA